VVKCRGTVADVAGFTKETAWWLRSWWLSNISDADAGRPPVGALDAPTIRIIDSWEAPPSGSQNRTVHVFSNAPVVELQINGRRVESQEVPFFGTVAFTVPFEEGQVQALAKGHSGDTLARHAVRSTKAPAKLELSLDAPNPRTGTGSALVLDGEDVAMLGARILDAQGALATAASLPVTFKVVQGPGRIIATHSGDPADKEPAHSTQSTTYHGLTRAFVRASEDSSTGAVHRQRLLEIDVDGNSLTKIVKPDALTSDPVSIIIRAEAPGLSPAEVEIPTTRDLSLLPLGVAATSFAQPIEIGDDPLDSLETSIVI
jgi:hypothetical protein